MEDVKQVIVMRKDLNMRKGKMIAQGAHASVKVFFDKIQEIIQRPDKLYRVIMLITHDMFLWMNNSFTKICVYVNSEEELLTLYQKAKDQNLPCALIKDAGRTEFNNVATYTCIAIGPAKSTKIDEITGDLKLL